LLSTVGVDADARRGRRSLAAPTLWKRRWLVNKLKGSDPARAVRKQPDSSCTRRSKTYFLYQGADVGDPR
jgi:hypothetical protein